MRKLKLFLTLLMLISFGITQVWADPAAVGTTLFSEDFSSYAKDAVPSGSVSAATGRVVYGSGSVTYSVTNGGSTTKIYTENLAGGTSPEILVGKSNGTLVIEGIPAGGAQEITVSYKQNKQKLKVEASGTGYSGSKEEKPSASQSYSFDVTVADGAAETFTLTFTCTGSSNVRVDDILVTVKTAGEGAAPVTPTCATPTFDPEDGETFDESIDVEIASATEGVTIYYTTDGNNPTTSSDVYTTPLNFTETTTLKAMAVKEGSNNSAVATATYTKVVPFAGSILEIVKGDFNTSSYDDNAGDHEKSGITFTTAKVYQSGGGIQFQKTNGLLYNKTDLGEIAKIEITTVSGKSNNLVVYSGTTENPTSGAVTGSTSGSVTTYTFAAGKGFFAIKCNSTGASNVDPIKIYYVLPMAEVTLSANGGTLIAMKGGDAVESGTEVAAGTELVLTATPDSENHYIGGTITVKKTSDNSDVTSDVLDGNTLTVPDYAITVSAAFTPTYAINIVADGGSVALDYTAGGAAEGYAIAGTEIMATVTADGSHLFKALALSDNVTVKEIDDNVAMFTMPEGAVTITATFDDKPCDKLATPANAAVNNLAYPYNAATLDWDNVANADAYEVTIKKAGVVVESDVVEESAYTFSTTLLANTTYTYEIVATSENAAAYCPSDAASAEFATADYPTVAVIYSENGETNNARTAAATATKILTPFALPMEATACSQTFVGWTTKADFEDGDESEATYYEAGAEFTIESNEAVMLYAVYADVEGVESSIELDANTTNMPTSYGTANTFSEYTLAGLKYQIQQMYKSGGKLQWRAGGNSSGTGTIYNSDKINNIRSIVLTYNSSDDNKNFGLKVGSSANPTSGPEITQSVSGSTGTFDCSLGAYDYFVLTNGSGAGYLDKLTINYISSYNKSNYTISCTDLLDAPTFALAPAVTPVDGKYQEAINVKIEATEGDIYYTINGADPTNESTPYEGLIALTESGTYVIKAIAISSNNNSAVVSQTYVLNIPLSTIDAIFAKAKEVKSTETAVDVTFGNWVVSATKDANAYVTDGTKGFIIYASNHGFNVGDVLSGTANCKVKLYAGSAELTTLTSETTGLTVTPNGSVDAATKTIAELDSINTGALVVLNGLFYNGSKLVDASDKEISPYNALYSELALEANHVYNITGIFVQYNTTKELAPRAAADIVDATEYVKVSFDANANDATGDLPEDVTGLIAGHNSYTIPTEKPLTREAYLQIGWNTDKDADVALEGNLTNITANTTLYAIWTAKATCAITFYDRGEEHAEVNQYQGVEYTIDVDDPEAPSGYTFAGWSADPITTEVTSAELVTTITPASATMSLYAVYTRSEGETVIVYNKVTSTPDDWAGKYLIVNEEAGKAFNGSLETLDAVGDVIAVTINEGVIAGLAEVNAAVFTVAAATSNYSIRSASGFYIGQTANSNGLLSSTTTVYTNTLAISEGDAVITSSGSPTLRYNKASDQNRFRYYKSGQQPVQLYKQNVTLPTVYYTTNPVNRYTVSFDLKEGEQGSFSDISVVQGEDAILPAAVPTKLHYTFNKWKDANNNEYAAEAVIENVTKNIVLSATWTENSKANVTFDANGGSAVAAINDVYEGETYNLPDAPTYGTNIFGGWKVGDNVYAAGTEMTMSTPAAAIEYVAQWTAVPEFNAGYWFKVTDASTLAAGQFVMIVAEDADYALAPRKNSNTNRAAQAIKKVNFATEGVLIFDEEPAIMLLQNGATAGQYAFYTQNLVEGELANGRYLCTASTSNNMKLQEGIDQNSSWAISINASGVASIEAAGSNNYKYMRYNPNTSGNPLFSCYNSNTTQHDLAIYRYEQSDKLLISYAGKGTEHVQGALVDAGGNVTLAAAPAAPEAEDVTYSFVSWIVEGVEYAPAAEIANITEDKVVYAKWNVETKEAATEIIIPVEDVVASDIHVKANKTVTIEVTEDATLGNLDLENGAILDLDITPGATVAANDLILRSNSADRNAQQGKSSQAPGVLPAINGILALEIDLRPELAADATLSTEQSEQWYCISAPFDVDINSGFEWVYPDGHRTAMIHNTDFQIFAYDGARRATGISGWKRTSGTMKAGVAHFIGFDNARTNQKVIRLTAKTNTVASTTAITLGSYPGASDVQNWNGVANPTLQYIGIDKNIVAFDYGIQDYNTYAAEDYNYFVGSPFFIQQDGGSIAIDYNNRGGAIHAPQREAETLAYCVRINAASANCFESQLYVRASETASYTYEEGHDMASQSSTTPKYGARIWSENYNMRLGIEEAPLTNGNASYVLGIATPAAGEYTISVAAPKENATLYLTYNGSIIWNLSNGAYTIDLPKGITSGYGLVMKAKAPQVGTDIESQTAIVNGVEKVVINNTIYILRDQQMYDLTGKMVK